MKELTVEQATKKLKRGEPVICQLSKRIDDTEIVKDVSRLEYLDNLRKTGTKMCIIFQIPNDKIKIPDNAHEVSFDEAFIKVYSGELAYYQREDGTEEEINVTEDLISARRSFEMKGKKLLLYMYE